MSNTSLPVDDLARLRAETPFVLADLETARMVLDDVRIEYARQRITLQELQQAESAHTSAIQAVEAHRAAEIALERLIESKAAQAEAETLVLRLEEIRQQLNVTESKPLLQLEKLQRDLIEAHAEYRRSREAADALRHKGRSIYGRLAQLLD
ncbi:hypothetical protein, partial [Deinococcus ruber]|uniref:hypothetical protein n=1 Tax=Deinococcus ruber TaxID=1848197 RepID=UPI001665B030